MKENFDKIFEHLREYKETPPESVWQRISFTLTKRGFFKKPKHQERYFYLAVIALLLLFWFINEWFSLFHLGRSSLIVAQQASNIQALGLPYPSRVYKQTIPLTFYYVFYTPSNTVQKTHESELFRETLEHNEIITNNFSLADYPIRSLEAFDLKQLPVKVNSDTFYQNLYVNPFDFPHSWFEIELTGAGFEKIFIPELYKEVYGYNWGPFITFHSNNIYTGTGVYFHTIYVPNRYKYSKYETFVKDYTMGIDSIVLIQSELDKISFQPLIYAGYHPIYDSVLKNYTTEHPDAYYYAEIPLHVGFQNQINRFGFKAELGFSINLRQGMKAYTKEKFFEETGIVPVNWKPFNYTMSSVFYNFSLKGGIFYQFLPSWNAGVNVYYRNYLSPVFENEGKNFNYPSSMSVSLSISKTL
ncbi:MAG: hypothetical protein N2Z72_03115 [Bacteroidales bacterium]|nr:hypothetical protein [Bacteroidales bacterium]